MSATLYSSLKAFKPKSPKGRLDLVFPNLFGEPANRTGIGRHGLRPALETAGIDKNIKPHSLRHTSASMLIALGRKVAQVSAYLGHAAMTVTLQVYAHFLKEKKQDGLRCRSLMAGFNL